MNVRCSSINARGRDNGLASRRPWLRSGLGLIVLLPVFAAAHEDLLLRISGVTEQIRTNGSRAELLLQRAELYRSHQDWVPALWDYDAAEKRLTNTAAVDLGRAQALAGWGKPAEARVVFDRVLQHNPTNAVALLGRARVLTQLDQPKLAIADYSCAITNQAQPRPDDYLERARLQAAEFGPAEATKGLDEGLARLGWVVTLQRAALDYDLAQGNPTGALTRLETIIVRSSHPESWLVQKGEILQKSGRLVEAQAVFQTALNNLHGLPPRLAATAPMAALQARAEAALREFKYVGPAASTDRGD